MNRTKILLMSIASICITLLGVGLYLQLVENMLPCPLCVAQRYAFALIAVCCLLAMAFKGMLQRFASILALIASLFGAAIAGRHLWVLANPAVSCGIDPLEVAINKIFLTDLLPVLFKANGLCDAPYPPILGLSIPGWAFVWFAVFSLILLLISLKKDRSERELFGKSR